MLLFVLLFSKPENLCHQDRHFVCLTIQNREARDYDPVAAGVPSSQMGVLEWVSSVPKGPQLACTYKTRLLKTPAHWPT